MSESTLLCRYVDCAEGHRIANDGEPITCPVCRAYLGLPPLSEQEVAIGKLAIARQALERVKAGLCYPDGYYEVAAEALAAIDKQ